MRRTFQCGPRGFTVIELLVSVAVLVIISGGAIVAYVNFTSRRVAIADAQAVAQYLRTVQKKASAVEVPPGASGVTNYSVVIGASSLVTTVNCSVGCPVAGYMSTLNVTESQLSVSPASPIMFQARVGGALIAAPVVVTTCSHGIEHNITVNRNGLIDGPVLDASGC